MQLIRASREMPVVLTPALGKVSRSLGWAWGAGRDPGRGGQSADLGRQLAWLRFDDIRAPRAGPGEWGPTSQPSPVRCPVLPCPPEAPLSPSRPACSHSGLQSGGGNGCWPATAPAKPCAQLCRHGSGLVGVSLKLFFGRLLVSSLSVVVPLRCQGKVLIALPAHC